MTDELVVGLFELERTWLEELDSLWLDVVARLEDVDPWTEEVDPRLLEEVFGAGELKTVAWLEAVEAFSDEVIGFADEVLGVSDEVDGLPLEVLVLGG